MKTYELTIALPLEERYGLTSQLRRAAVAIPSNIGKWHQQGTKASLHYVTRALGSLAEVETQIEIACRLRYVSDTAAAPVLKHAARLRSVLHGLKRSLTARRQLQQDKRRSKSSMSKRDPGSGSRIGSRIPDQ